MVADSVFSAPLTISSSASRTGRGWSPGTARPHLLLAHNPDQFYEAEGQGVPLTLSGHTHGGQIRFPNGPPIIRHSRFCLDEGLYSFRSSLLLVSRGLGSVGLPWRWGADPEAMLIEIDPRE